MQLSSSFLYCQNFSVSGIYYLPYLLLLLLLVSWLLWWDRDPNRHRYPPGPGYALPLIGNLYQLVGTSSPHVTFLKWKKQYGPLVFFKMGSDNTVLVNNAKLSKELLSTLASSGRPNGPVCRLLSSSGHGLLLFSGKNWATTRSFAIKTLAELGLSKSGRLEGIILDEADNLVKYFEQRADEGAPFRASRLFNGGAASTLWTIVSGEKAEWIDKDGLLFQPDISRHAGQVMARTNQATKFGLTVLPGLRYLPGFSSIWSAYEGAVDNFHGMVDAMIQAHHSKALDVLSSPTDFIDYGLLKIGSTKDPSSSFYKEKGRLNLRTAVKDLFFAGNESTSSAIDYLLMYLGTHPQVQEKLQKELDAVIGGRRPTLSDRIMLPYAQAVIMETLRRSASTAAIPHRILHDTEFHGYLLPKDTLVLFDVYGIHREESSWKDAFRPERFLTKNESEVVVAVAAPDDYMPFGTGRRRCIGESLALDTLFLCMASIFLRFRVEVVHDDDGGGHFDLDDVKPGFTLEHEPFDIRVYQRRV